MQRHVLYEARELQESGHDVTLYTFIFSKEECFSDLLGGLKVISLNTALPSYSNYFSWKTAESALAKRLALMIDPEMQILNPHDHGCYKVAYYFKKLVKNIPSVWTMHDMPTRAYSAKMAEETRLGFQTPFFKKIANYLLDRYEIEKYIKKQDIVVVLNARDKELAKIYFGKNAEIIRNGVDISRFPFFERAPPKDRVHIFMSGIFFRHRRFEDGICAVKLLSDSGYDIFLSIAGDYNSDKKYYEELSALIRKIGLKNKVRFLGKVSEERLLELYKTSDIFLFPNHMQSWGLAVFEAMACGTPVIVSKSAGASEVLVNEENAMLVDPKSPEGLAETVKKLITRPDLYLKLSRNGREFVEENISWERLASGYSRLFKYAKKE